ADLHLWAMGSTEDNFLAKHWQSLNCSWQTIADPLAPRPPQLRPDKTPPASPSATSPNYELRAMLFADIKNYSTLDDASLRRFHEQFMPAVARILEPFADRVLLRRTAGDGLF